MDCCRERNSQGGRANFRNRGTPIHSGHATARHVAWQGAASSVIWRDDRCLRRQRGENKSGGYACARWRLRGCCGTKSSRSAESFGCGQGEMERSAADFESRDIFLLETEWRGGLG